MAEELPLIAAAEWARTNAYTGADPVEFGHKVAQVYLAARAAKFHAGDEKATAAALPALSVPVAVWQSLVQLAAHSQSLPTAGSQTARVDSR